MALSVTECADLFEPCGLANCCGSSSPDRCGFHRFLWALSIPRKNPLLTPLGRSAKKNRELTADRCEEHDIDRA
jgi:hypothetical protein